MFIILKVHGFGNENATISGTWEVKVKVVVLVSDRPAVRVSTPSFHSLMSSRY